MRLLLGLAALFGASVGWMAGRRGSRRLTPEERGILVFPTQPPPPGTRLMIVRAPRKLIGGKLLRVTARHYEGGGPIAGVAIRLVDDLTGDVVAHGKTNHLGVSELPTPTVTGVSTYIVQSEKPGFAFYIPAEDPRAWAALQGIYPEPALTLWPTTTAPTLSPHSPKIVVDVGFGWIGDIGYGGNFDALETTAGALGWDYSEDDWADKDQICENIRGLGPQDVWVFSGHGNQMRGSPLADAICPWRPGATLPTDAFGYARMYPDEICHCFGPNGGPGVIFLDACGGGGMADALVACCARMVLGWDRAVTGKNSASATRQFWIAMLSGATLQASITTAEKVLNRGIFRGSLMVRTKPWLGDASNLTLEEILAIAPPVEPPAEHHPHEPGN